MGLENRPVACRGIQNALVGVMDEAGFRSAPFNRHGEGIDGELPATMLSAAAKNCTMALRAGSRPSWAESRSRI
jgi:hypothetical protein